MDGFKGRESLERLKFPLDFFSNIDTIDNLKTVTAIQTFIEQKTNPS
jgi:hypothetical protein